MTLLRVSNISLRENGHPVLHDLSFRLERGQKLAVAGASGAGKSTLLQTIAGLVQPTTGSIFVNGQRVKGPQEQLMPGHAGVAYLSQHFELPKSLRVEQVLRYANTRPAAEAATLYARCGIEGLLGRRTHELSGGERQRVALVRQLLAAPQLLLLDEPFSNLDRRHRQQLQAVLHDASAALGITCVLVSHEPADVLPWADEVLVLRAGRLVQHGPPARIYQQPADEHTAGLFGDYQVVSGALARALAHAAGQRYRAAPLLIRPENLRLQPAGAAGLPGTVAAVRYFGSYSEVDVNLAAGPVTVKTTAAGMTPDAPATVGLAAKGQFLL